jgi:peptidylprolyl isomerase/peptidyl-prolyl cis-trans isomerase B (cyclophilin B)
VNNFVTLARYHYFDGVSCHRIIPGFMAQCGDPTGTGSGGPGYDFPDELPDGSDAYTAGTLAMANAGPNTNGSQFFIITGDATFLPPSYSVFGTVTDGMDDTLPALDAAGNPADNGVPPLEPVTIESVTITES